MPEFFSHPVFPEPSSDMDCLKAHQLTYEFRQELHYRLEFEHYCNWYHQTSEQHRRELKQMRGDINLLGWFYRKRPD